MASPSKADSEFAYWNYRMRRFMAPGLPEPVVEQFDIIEAYYDSNGTIVAWAVYPGFAMDSLNDLVGELMRVNEARLRPVVLDEDLPRESET